MGAASQAADLIVSSTDEFPHMVELRRALVSGSFRRASEHTLQAVAAQELLRIYQVRAKHLSSMDAEHPRRLRQDVLWMLERLPREPGATCFIGSYETNDSRYVIVEAIEPPAIVGCMRVVSRLDVDDDAWRRLWGDHS
jgi:hypothetical protein